MKGDISSRERWLILGGCFLVACLYVGIASYHGALGVSRNDDWTYYRIAFDFHRTGEFLPDSYTRTMLLGQVVMTQPLLWIFGNSLVAHQVFMVLLGTVGLLAAYAVVRSFLPAGWAAFSVGILAFGPIYGSASVSYMSDVPSFAIQCVALWIAVRALESRGPGLGWLALSLMTCFVGFSVREYAAGAALAVVTTFVWARRDLSAGQRWVAVGLGLAWLLAAALLYHWRGDVPAAEGPDKAIASPDDWLKIAFLSFMTMAALLTPVLVLLWHRGMWSGRRRWLLVTCAVLVAVPALKVRGHFLLGNYFTRWGSYPETLWGPQPEVFPRLVWFLLLLIILGASVAGLAWLLDVTYEGVARRRAQSAEREESRTSTVPAAVVLSVVFGGATFIMAVVTGVLATGVIFDRYLIAAVPFLAAAFVWVLRQQEPGRALGRWATLSLAAWSIIGLHQVDVSATFDAAKWRMGETLVEAGYEPDTIDAGLEWFGLHQPGQVHKPAGVQPAGYPFWLTLFDSPRLCVVTAYDTEPSNLAGVDVVARSSASSLLGTELTLVAHRVDLRC